MAGFSLGGFEIPTNLQDGQPEVCAKTEKVLLSPEGAPEGPIYSLREQIRLTARRLEALVRMLAREESGVGEESSMGDDGVMGRRGRKRWKVVLIGHSVGAYIALEFLRMNRQQQQQQPDDPFSDLNISGSASTGDFEITGAILLTPTIVDIALSFSGRIVTPVLKYVPGFSVLVSLGAKLITTSLPDAWLRTLVKTVMGSDTPDVAVMTTASFLRSRNGVRQSLDMAADEMREIGPDMWEEEVWGLLETGEKDAEDRQMRLIEPVELICFFAMFDHWVANQTREAIIETRGGKGEIGRPRMIVAEENGLVHGWCLRHNTFMAQKVDAWVEEMIEGKKCPA